MTACDCIALVIPVCDPDEARFPSLVRRLRADFAHIVVVDDGSAHGRSAFDDVRGDVDAVLIHENNRGKGAALRTAFAWVRENLPRMVGVVTVDGDGQHDPEDVRRVAELALLNKASACIIAHNHPSGDLTPSADDRLVTAQIASALQTLHIPLLDHIIVGMDRTFSFADAGLLS